MVLYRLIMAILTPVILARALWRGEALADLAERLGFAPGADLWVHGASNGEVTSARWVIEALLAARPGLTVLVTCNTLTARAMVRGWQNPRIGAALAPLDGGLATHRLLTRSRARALISLEAELWPARIVTCAARGVPVLMLGARMSPRSAKGWGRVAGLARAALSRVSLASAQDGLSRDHLLGLGLNPAALTPDLDLKAHATSRLPQPAPRPRAERAGWLLAASTHDGEEAAILDAFAASALDHLILAPRHPARAAEIAALLQARGLAFAQRSQGGQPGSARVLLADTLGEMDLWYATCGICLIGGTLVDKGGHTPWEPARHGCALLHGPSTWNFAGPFAQLDAAAAALPVTATDLARVLGRLDAAAQDHMAAEAAKVLRPTGDPRALLASILAISRA